MSHDRETFPHALSMYLTRNNTAIIVERSGTQIGQPEIEAKIQDFLCNSRWEVRGGAREMSESTREVELSPPIIHTYPAHGSGFISFYKVDEVNAYIRYILDRAERYMDLCGEKDKDIERLKRLIPGLVRQAIQGDK